MDMHTSFGRWLRARRRALDLTQDDLARRVGCSVVTIRKIEADERRPSRQIAERLVDSLRIPADQRAAIITLARAEPYLDPAPGETPERSLRAPQRPPTNLPAPLTRLIGRKQDIAAVRNALMRGDARLLTLIGPPGIGKTRLSIEIARDMHDAFTDGASFVALAPIGDPALVTTAIAQTLGIKETAGQPLLETLKAALHMKRLLLVLDNFEHLLDAAPLVVELLEVCGGLKALITSRAALHVRGERLYGVPPLLLPDLTHLPGTGALSHNPAVALLVERAQAVMPDFTLTAQNAPAVAAICARLDGLPLAIELAAVRIKLFTPEELLARLERRLPLLTDGALDLPPRHQTLRATIGWSYDLLLEPERVLLRRLAVFAGGCALDAAEAVCGDEPIARWEVLELLTQLVNRSLVDAERHGNHSRYRMLETIREYAHEKLLESGEDQRVQARHSAFFLDWAEELEPKLRGAEQVTWLNRLELEHDNLRAALAWSLTHASETGLRLAAALAWFWRVHNHFSEGRRWLEMACALTDPPPTLRVKALVGAGLLAYAQDDDTQATALLEESLMLSRSQGDQWGIGWSLHGLGRVADGQGAYERATTLFEESLAPLRAIDDTSVAYSLDWLGVVAGHRRDYDRAAAFFAEGLSIAREAGDTWLIAWALIQSGRVAHDQGDYARATALLAEGLVSCRELRSTWGIMAALETLAQVAAAQESPARAVRLFGAAASLHDILGIPPYTAAYDPQLTTARTQLGAGAFDAAWAEGLAMTVEQAIAEVLRANS